MDFFFGTLALIFASIGFSLSILLFEGRLYRWVPAVVVATAALSIAALSAGWHA